MKCTVVEEPAPTASGPSYYVYLYNSIDRMLKEYHIIKDTTTGGYKFVAASDTFLKISANMSFNIILRNSVDNSILRTYKIFFSKLYLMTDKKNDDVSYVDNIPRIRLMIDRDNNQLNIKGINGATPSGDGIFKKFDDNGFLDPTDLTFYMEKAVVKKGVTIMVGTTWALPDEAPQSQSRGTECNVTVFDNLSLVSASTVAAHGIQVYQDSTDSQYFIIDCGATVTRPSVANPGVIYNYEYGSSTSTVSGAIKDKYKLKVPKTLFSEDYSSSKGRFTVNYKLA